MISKFKFMVNPLNHILPSPSISTLLSLQFLPQINSIKNPKRTLIHHFPQSIPQFPRKPITMSSSWSCKVCTFLNPSSQKLDCLMCQTPTTILPPSSSSSPLSKQILTTTTTISSSSNTWACKACTFLNSYSLSNCEICDTRIPSINLDYGDDDFVENSSLSDVGSVFFPLRKCSSSSTTRVPDTGGPKFDLGYRDNDQIETGTGEFVPKGVDFGGSSANLPSLKRKFDDHFSENEDAMNGAGTINKKDKGGDVMDSTSDMIVDDTECSVVFKRKRDPSDFVENPVAFNGFREVKSSKKQTTVLDEKVRTKGTAKGSVAADLDGNGEVKNVSGTIKILSYNVWFRDELEGYLRMQAIGNLIQIHSPDIICFQEVNSVLYAIFQKSSWWKNYRCSVSFERSQNEAYFCMQLAKLPVKSFTCKPFRNTAMRRELCMAHIEVNDNKPLIIATSHLESPCPGPPTWDQMYSKERVDQAKEAITILQQYPNVIFCGDMNWDEKKDGRFPFPEGWFDAWEKLRPAEVGYTYDTKSNAMLKGNRALQKRLDRFICHLPDFRVIRIDMIGTEPIPGLEYKKEKKVKGKIQEVTLPVLPSDHYGLLLTVTTV